MEPKDLTGQRFGRLTVLQENPIPYKAPSGKLTRRWDCICDCGKRVTVLHNALAASQNPTRSCGCSRRMTTLKDDLAGRKFGRLTVIGPGDLEKPEANGNRTGWLCRCECGNYVVLPRRYLIQSGVRSCGCLLVDTATEKQKSVFGFFEGTMVSGIRHPDKVTKASTTGVRGVRTRGKRFEARIGFQGKTISLGRYDTIEEATEARRIAEEKYYKPIVERYDAEHKKEDI